jgi:SagB-type dehydrogenase family enzyme
MTWREYHESTKHTPESLRRTPHFLDWDHMPDPFRHYEGVPLLDLPADPEPPNIPALNVLLGEQGQTQTGDGAAFLSELLFFSAAISASKRVPATGGRYALRVNPSSGNLHPTEFHFITRGLNGWPDGAYHYRPSSHAAEQRARGSIIPPRVAPVTVLLTSIAWREAWKYRSRAYRYCLHDIGHAWQAVVLAARATGCDAKAAGCFADDDLSATFHLSEDEWPMLLIQIDGPAMPRSELDRTPAVWFGGEPNRLSAQTVPYPSINSIHDASKLQHAPVHVPCADPAREGSGAILLPFPKSSARPFGEVVRGRRSALDFIGGHRTIPLAALSAILDGAQRPFQADFDGASLVQLYLYVHRVDDLEPGVYRHWPRDGRLERIRSGDQRVAAAGLSLGQDLAGNACVAFSMIADLHRATRAYGDRGYRYAHFLAGAIGQRMYVAAEALELRATGIGAFFDDRVHDYLGVKPEDGQVIYHFAIGYPVADPRLDA